MHFFACAHQYTPAHMHRGDAELSPVDKQMTDKWLVGTPPPCSIVIAPWDCANGISYRERERGGAREQEPRVSFYTNKTSASHRMWLLPPPSTVANLIALSIWVYREEGHGLKGGEEKWNRKEWKKRWISCIGQRILILKPRLHVQINTAKRIRSSDNTDVHLMFLYVFLHGFGADG